MKHLTSQRIYHGLVEKKARQAQGNRFKDNPVLAKAVVGTTDMQARPGAKLLATSRKIPITAFSRPVTALPSP